MNLKNLLQQCRKPNNLSNEVCTRGAQMTQRYFYLGPAGFVSFCMETSTFLR